MLTQPVVQFRGWSSTRASWSCRTSAGRPTWQGADNRFTFTACARSHRGRINDGAGVDGLGVAAVSSATRQFARNGNPVHIAISRQRQRVRVYFNEDKVWDVPRALLAEGKYNSIIFFVPTIEAGSEYFVANLRLAVGAPDTRNKLLTEGKWVTHGILFDVNSDRVRPESYGALKEIANVLTESADVKVQVVGHTDSDGDAAQNLDLSKRRAASVRAPAREGVRDRGSAHGHRRQGREPAGRQERLRGRQGQQPARGVHQEVARDRGVRRWHAHRSPAERRSHCLRGAPFATRLAAQARPQVRRVFQGKDHTLLLEPDGTLKCWSVGRTPNVSGEFGQGHFNMLEPYRLYTVPGLSNVVSAAAGWDTSFAVLADGRILSWGAKGNTGTLGTTPLAEVEVSAEARANSPTPTPVAARFDAVDLSLEATTPWRLHATARCGPGAVEDRDASASDRSRSSTSRPTGRTR